jgi:hypothetical protein
MAVSENDLLVGPLAPANGVTLISLDFFFENASDLQVFKSGGTDPLTIVTDYTVTLPSGPGLTDGSITLTTPANGTDRYSIYLVPPIQRSSDLQFRGGFQAGPVNLELDRLWRAVQALDTALERTFRFTQTGDVPARLNVETAAERVNQLIGFTADGTGLTLIATPEELETLASLTDEIAVIGNLETEITALGALGTELEGVYAIRADVSTVASMQTNVATVAGIETEVADVAAIDAAVATVAAADEDIEAVAAIAAAVSTVAGIETEVQTVAGDTADIQTLAGIAADITALAAGSGGSLTGDWTASGLWDFNGTSYLGIPRGTTAQGGTPGASVRGIRYDNELAAPVIWTGSEWAPIGASDIELLLEFDAAGSGSVPQNFDDITSDYFDDDAFRGYRLEGYEVGRNGSNITGAVSEDGGSSYISGGANLYSRDGNANNASLLIYTGNQTGTSALGRVKMDIFGTPAGEVTTFLSEEIKFGSTVDVSRSAYGQSRRSANVTDALRISYGGFGTITTGGIWRWYGYKR